MRHRYISAREALGPAMPGSLAGIGVAELARARCQVAADEVRVMNPDRISMAAGLDALRRVEARWGSLENADKEELVREIWDAMNEAEIRPEIES